MRIYNHKDYGEYLTAQTKKNVRKLSKTRRWIWGKDVRAITKHAEANIPNIDFGICHGVRNGWEVREFRRHLKTNIIGTEISHTATQFENVIHLDFHNIKSEWIDNVDFIYSNALDHSSDPEYCIDRWMKCLKKDGICYIHWSKNHNIRKLDAADCFAATKDEYRTLFNQNYHVVDEIEVKRVKRNRTQERVIFAIKHGPINNYTS